MFLPRKWLKIPNTKIEFENFNIKISANIVIKRTPKSSSWINNYHYRFKKDTINNNNFLTQQQWLQIIELPDHGLDGLTVLDLNLNENELGYLGDSLAKAPRLKVSLLKLEEQSVS